MQRKKKSKVTIYLDPDLTAALADFARTCKAATRSVSMYPATHPAIQASLSRVAAAAGRLVAGRELTLTIHPDTIAIEGRTPARHATTSIRR